MLQTPVRVIWSGFLIPTVDFVADQCYKISKATLKQKFLSTGGKYVEVPADYRASQYDHTVDKHIKKTLSQRMFRLQEGPKVQRDWYSSFLLYCINDDFNGIDREKCLYAFPGMYEKEQTMIERIVCSGKRIMNSGIRAVT